MLLRRWSFCILCILLVVQTCSAETATGDLRPAEFASFFSSAPAWEESSHFMLIYQGTAQWAQQTGQMLETVFDRFYAGMRQHGFILNSPPQRLTWLAFAQTESFRSYALQADQFDASWLNLYYSSKTNCVAFAPRNTSAGFDDYLELSHEEAHQLSFNSGLLVRGATHPAWLTEGLATTFECKNPENEGLPANQNSLRLATLHDAGQNHRLMPFRQFLVLPQFRPGGDYDVRDLYAEGEGLFRFLLNERPEQLKAYFSLMATKGQGQRNSAELLEEIQQAFGDPAALEKDFLQFIDDAGQMKLANVAAK